MYISDRLKQTDEETFTFRIPNDRDFKILQLTDLHLGFGFISRRKDKLMYISDRLKQTDEETFTFRIPNDRDFKILQLTDLHLGFGFISRRKDKLALNAVRKIIDKSKPDMIVLTGDSIFPFLPKSGTCNNRKQANKLLEFLDSFEIPYTLVFGKPDMIVLTGDSIFPFLPKSGTCNNRKQANKLLEFLDSFEIPYTLVFGNHDCEIGSICNKQDLAQIYKKGKYCIFTEGKKSLTGVGNFFIELVDDNHDCEIGSICNKQDLAQIYKKGKYCIFTEGKKSLTGVGNFFIELVDDYGKLLLTLVMLDSNMYGDGGWFFSGFDHVHDDQTDWCVNRLNLLKHENPDSDFKAMAFFHMPPREFKEAYEKMKLADKSVVYCHGSIAEKNDYFGISKFKNSFFDRIVENGLIKWMFCGHDHLNTLSLIYKGIQITYGMSIDYLGYTGIKKNYTQRGGTLITRKADGSVEIKMVPLESVVAKRIRGEK